MLELRLFGPGEAVCGQSPLPGFPEQQPYQLMCYLVLCRRQPQRRERLAALLWGDCPTSVSLKHLRNVLWRLRRYLQAAGVSADDYLQADDDCVTFTGTGPYWLDVEVFEAAMLRYQDLRSRDLAEEQAREMEAALQVYTGELLHGIYEDWCLFDRERLRALYFGGLTKLMTYYRLTARYEQSLAYGRQILALDETLERVHRHVMRLYWLMGNRNAALKQYQRCIEVLVDTLQVLPSEATQRLYQAIIRSDAPARPLARPGVSTSRGNAAAAPAPELLARTLERLERLEEALAAMRAELSEISQAIRQVYPQETLTQGL